jgi:hypothetical protein
MVYNGIVPYLVIYKIYFLSGHKNALVGSVSGQISTGN